MEHHDIGFSLIEVLISLAVVSIGLLALGSLQVTYLTSGAEAKARSLAATLAREKLDDLRSFEQLEAGPSGVFGFDEIINGDDGASGGGVENSDGTLKLAEGTLSLSGIPFERKWKVEDYYIPPANAASQEPTTTWKATAWGPPPNRPDFKKVTVTVRWRSRGNKSDLSISGTIPAISPTTSGRTLSSIPIAPLPEVPHSDNQDPDVTSFKEGDTYRETTTPQTTLSGSSIVTRFEQLRYDMNRTLQSRTSFITINCQCHQATGNQSAYTPALPIGDGMEPGKQIFKRVGVPQRQTGYCEICCRDHHDIANQPGFDPFRPNNPSHYPAKLGGDHSHAYPNAEGTLVPADSDQDRYLEACRLTYIDGRLRVLQDWYMEKLIILPEHWLISNANQDIYLKYVNNFIDSYIDAIEPSKVANCSDASTDYSGYKRLGNLEVSSADLPKTTDTPAATTTRFHARAIYIDHMPSQLINQIKCRKQEERLYRHLIPFYEVDVTALATWSFTGPKSTNVSLQSGSLDIGDEVSGDFTLTASMKQSNTGLTGSESLDADDRMEKSDSFSLLVR